jgi:hypothetical protein
MSDQLPNAEYAAILRSSGTDVLPVVRIYVTALTLIRQLLRLEGLAAQDKLDEISLVFSGLERVQEDLDRADT